jgi:hypothetical protein
MSKVGTFCIIARIIGIDVLGLITIPRYLHPPLSFKVLIDAVQCISKSKYRQSSGQKANNDIGISDIFTYRRMSA